MMYGIVKEDFYSSGRGRKFEKNEIIDLYHTNSEKYVQHGIYSLPINKFIILRDEEWIEEKIKNTREHWSARYDKLSNESATWRHKAELLGKQLAAIEQSIEPMVDGEEPGTDADHIKKLMDELRDYRATEPQKDNRITIGGNEFRVEDELYTIVTLKSTTTLGDTVPRGIIGKARMLSYKKEETNLLGLKGEIDTYGYQFIEGAYSGCVINPHHCIELAVIK